MTLLQFKYKYILHFYYSFFVFYKINKKFSKLSIHYDSDKYVHGTFQDYKELFIIVVQVAYISHQDEDYGIL